MPAIFLLCGVAFFSWAVYSGGRNLREAMAEAAADDPHWQIHEIEANRKEIADKDNSTLVIAAGKALFIRPTNAAQSQGWEEQIGDLGKAPAHRLNEQQLEALTGLLSSHTASLVEYRKLKDKPWGRPPIKITPDIVSTLLPFTQDARSAVRALQMDAYQKIEATDASAATDAVLAGFNATRSIGDEPFLISALVRIACDAVALSTCERLLAQLELSESNLARLQATIELQLSDHIWRNAIRGERGFGHAYLQYLKDNPGKAQGMRGILGTSGGKTPQEWLAFVPGYISRGQAELLKHMNDAVAISRRPYEEHFDAYQEWDRKTKKLSYFAQAVSPSVVSVAYAALRHQAQLRSMWVCVAAERYRVQHKKWPDALEDLVVAKLVATVPLDPFDGKPLRWKTTDEGRVVYSVGKNRVDDGGNIDPETWSKGNGDVGYRLFDPDKRRQAPKPMKPTEIESPPPG